jgi:hypothetical protein
MHFPDKFKVKVDGNKVVLSIKINETCILAVECTIQEFEVMIAQFRGQLEK